MHRLDDFYAHKRLQQTLDASAKLFVSSRLGTLAILDDLVQLVCYKPEQWTLGRSGPVREGLTSTGYIHDRDYAAVIMESMERLVCVVK